MHRLTDTDIAEIIWRYTTPLPDGTWCSANAIAADFGVSCPAIRYQLRQHGVTIRSMSETQAGKQYKPTKDRGTPPLCACGCGQSVASYDRGRNRWRPYLSGHYDHVTINRGRPTDRRYSGSWLRVARQIKVRDGYACQSCGYQGNPKGNKLEVHHIDKNKRNDDPANLITLCARCHRKAELLPLQDEHHAAHSA